MVVFLGLPSRRYVPSVEWSRVVSTHCFHSSTSTTIMVSTPCRTSTRLISNVLSTMARRTARLLYRRVPPGRLSWRPRRSPPPPTRFVLRSLMCVVVLMMTLQNVEPVPVKKPAAAKKAESVKKPAAAPVKKAPAKPAKAKAASTTKKASSTKTAEKKVCSITDVWALRSRSLTIFYCRRPQPKQPPRRLPR